MKLFLFNLIAFIIAISSIQVTSLSEINFDQEGMDQISSLPLLDLDPLRNPEGKSSHGTEILPENVIERTVFTTLATLSTIPLLYYLPIYSLNRAKEFLLLI